MYPLNKIIIKPIELYKMCIDYAKSKIPKYKHGICYLTVGLPTMQNHAHKWQKQEGIYMNKDNCVTVLALEGILKSFMLPFKIKHNKAVQLVLLYFMTVKTAKSGEILIILNIHYTLYVKGTILYSL